jgi:predicted nucleic acid-binding protein
VSRFLIDDTFYAASRSWLQDMTSQGLPLIAPAIMLAEVAGAVARRTGSSQLGYQIAQRIRQVPTLQLVAISAELGDFAAQVASTSRLRGADALYVAVAHQLQMSLVSWDREQIDRTAGFINAYSPGP